MKKFCNKIAKKEWRVTIPNLQSPKSLKKPLEEDEEKNSKRSSGFYDFQEAQLEYDKSRSLPNSIYVDSSSSDSETEFMDAKEHSSQDLYSNIDKNNSKYEYDVPRISFKFPEPPVEDKEEKMVKKSEIQIVLQTPILEEDEAPKCHPSETFNSQAEEVVPRSLPLAVRKSGSDPNLSLRSLDSDSDNFYKVPRSLKVQHRLSQSLNDFDPDKMQEIISKSTHSSIEHISCSQVFLAQEKLDYCETRSKLPVRLRRATLLRKPKKAMDSWNNFKTKMSNMISEQAAQQRVGAFSDREKLALNIEEMYKSSKNKCKKLGKMFSSKLSTGRRSESSSEPNSPVVEKHKPKFQASDIEYRLNISDGVDSENVKENSEEVNEVKVNSEELNGVKSINNSPVSPQLGSELSEERDFSSIRSAFRKKLVYVPEGQSGFEDLRKYVKQGGDFCKELATILQERAEAEVQYAKNLSKLSSKLSRACKDSIGSVNDAWKAVASELEAKAEAHRITGNALLEETAKPLRNLTESQHRSRKQCETAVEKAARLLSDWRAAEAKGKKQSHACARDNEKLQDAAVIDTSKLGKQTLSKSTSLIHLAHRQNSADKENAKLEGKKKKAEDAVKKADIEYYTLCVRAERARLEWESAVLRGVNTFQTLEEERLSNLKFLLLSYLRHSTELQPRIIEATERLKPPIEIAEPTKDLIYFQNMRQTSQQTSEQLLPDFYCEHITLAMNRERRKQALIKLLHLIRQDIERERKSKNGLENLSKAIKQTPNFGSEDSQQSVVEKLYHMKSMLTYLEGARFKVQNALAELDSRPRAGHPLGPHITVTRDKSGLQQSVLKVPQWLREEFFETDRSPVSEKSLKSDQSDNSDPHINDVDDHVLHDWTHRGAADGNSNQPDSDFDEFSSQCSSTDQLTDTENLHPIAKCRAIYPYTPNLPDELLLKTGDMLKVYRQQDDGWWLGECNGNVGIFPATYVEIVPS